MIRITLLMLSLLMFSQSAIAGPSVLRIVADERFAPFSMTKQDGKPGGIDVEVFAEAAKRAGIEYTLEMLPWREMLKRMKAGTVDGCFPLFRSKSRKTWARFVGTPLHYTNYALFMRVSNKITFNVPQDLAGKTVGVNNNFDLGDAFSSVIKSGALKLKAVQNEADGIKALLDDDVDMYAGQVDPTYYMLNRMGLTSSIIYLPKLVRARRPAYVALSRAAKIEEASTIADRLAKALGSTYQDGTYNSIAHRYLLRF